MAKKKAAESDEEGLKKKLSEKRAGHDYPKEDGKVRGLRKRLKRIQRKRRALALRKTNAAGKKTEAPAKA